MTAADDIRDDVAHFLDELRASRLLNEDRLGAFARNYAAGGDPVGLAKVLREIGWLTPFQAEEILLGRGRSLVIGPYRILESVGQGGFGRVFKAAHSMMERTVALKVIAPELVQDDEVRTLFRREVLATTRLCHPNIALAYDANEIDGTLYLAMEFVEGPNLEDFLGGHGPLPVAMACAVLLQTAQALQYAHEQGLVHRDIKPGNLLLPRGGCAGGPLVKVVDFGLARLYPRGAARAAAAKKEEGGLGTPAFVAPEQACNFHDADIRSDLYSLGCTFYYALTGVLPFDGDNLIEILSKHLQEEPAPVESLRPELPPALASILRRLMAKRPEKRFQTPADLVAELNFFHGAGGSLPTPAAAPPAPQAPLLRLAQTRVIVPAAPPPAGALPTETLRQTPHSFDAPRETASAAGSAAPPTIPPGPVAGEGIGPEFCELWQGWFALVTALASGARLHVAEETYQRAHRRLLRGCREHAARPGGRREVFQRLETLLEPWVTAQALTGLDRAAARSLVENCRTAALAAGLSPRRRHSAPWRLALLAVAAALAGLAVKLASSPPRWLGSWLSESHPVGSAFPLMLIGLGIAAVVWWLLGSARA